MFDIVGLADGASIQGTCEDGNASPRLLYGLTANPHNSYANLPISVFCSSNHYVTPANAQNGYTYYICDYDASSGDAANCIDNFSIFGPASLSATPPSSGLQWPMVDYAPFASEMGSAISAFITPLLALVGLGVVLNALWRMHKIGM